MPTPKQPPLTQKVERGLQALSDAAGAIQDKDGAVAAARRWLLARAEWRSERGQGAQPAVPPDGATHQQVIDELVRRWEREHEFPYPFGPRDAKAISSLRQMPDFTLADCMARWEALLRDPWWRRRGIAIPDLVAQWARLASKVASNTGQASGATSAAARLARKLKG